MTQATADDLWRDFPKTAPAFEARFATEDDCRAYWIEARWGGQPACQCCQSTHVWPVRGGTWFECADCRHQNLAIIGTTGLGKSWLACALGHKACRDDRSVLYHRVPRLFDALALARGDGRHARMLKTLSRVDLLILDDWGLSAITHEQARDRRASCRERVW